MRCAPAALFSIGLLLGSEGVLRADDDPILFLSTREALAFDDARKSQPAPPPRVRQKTLRPTPGAKPAPPAFIPSSVEIADQYALVYDRDAPLFAEPVDADRQVAFGLWSSTTRRPGAAIAWDTENLPMGDGWDRVSLEFELPF